MAFVDLIKRLRPGRRNAAPTRETLAYPKFSFLGQPQGANKRFVYKPTPRNLRYFSRTTFARRAFDTIKNPIVQASWEIVPKKGIKGNSEISRQIDIVTRCFEAPNADDSFRTLAEAVIEDILCGAGAIEQEIGGDPERPLWMWPVDGLSIQVYPGWSGAENEYRYMQTVGYGAFSAAGGGAGIQLLNRDLVYIRPNPTTASPFGIGPLEVAFSSISRLLGVEEFAGNVAANASPSRALYLGDKVDNGALMAYRSWWEDSIEGQGKIPMIGGSEKPTILDLKPDGDSALYLKYQELLIKEIAVAFSLSPLNFSLEADLNRDSSEAATDRDWDHAIRPMAHLLEQYLTREVINGRLGFTQIEFKLRGMDRKDEKAAAEIHKLYYDMNTFTPNMILEELGLPKATNVWGDKTAADAQIAIQAARGAKVIDNPDEPQLDTAPDDALTPNDNTPDLIPKSSTVLKPAPAKPGKSKRT